MGKTRDELVLEAYKNVNEDRDLLKKTLARIESEAAKDPMLLPSAVKSAVMIGDILIRANSQLIELAKVQLKVNPDEDPSKVLSEREVDTMWDAIADNEGKGGGEDKN